MLSYSVYFEIKHQKMVHVCIFVEYTCAYNLAEKVPLVTEILAQQHRGYFYGTPCIPNSNFMGSALQIMSVMGRGQNKEKSKDKKGGI